MTRSELLSAIVAKGIERGGVMPRHAMVSPSDFKDLLADGAESHLVEAVLVAGVIIIKHHHDDMAVNFCDWSEEDKQANAEWEERMSTHPAVLEARANDARERGA